MDERGWSALEEELDSWAEEGRVATLWWRDDDATRPGAPLERLLALASDHSVPLALAVIPALLDPALGPRVRDHGKVAVLQHGFAHRDHSAAGEKSVELGARRPRDEVRDELRRGFARLASAFGEDVLPVLVPPWNRIAAHWLPELPPLGLRGLSTFTPRPAPEPVPGLRQVNCHVDLIDWRGGRGGREHGLLAREVAGNLRARREGGADAGEPTGLLTHHLVHDDSAWAFVETFLGRVAGHPAARWQAPRDVFPV